MTRWNHRRRSRKSGVDTRRERDGEIGPEGERKRKAREEKWWNIRLFQGITNDLRRRAPFYWSDWREAWDYRVVPATIYMYFAKSVYVTYHTMSIVSRKIPLDSNVNIFLVFCPRLLSHWTCSIRQSAASASTRSF